MSRDQQWFLFGYDMRLLGQHWLGAWRDLLWGMDSPLRRRLDEPVRVMREGESVDYQAGRPLVQSASTPPGCKAVCLPEELVLRKPLRLPLAAEDALDSVLALEVAANSPFSASDTTWGYTLLARGSDALQLQLCIASRSAVMACLGSTFGVHQPTEREVWAEAGGQMACLRGFGEAARDMAYKRRLLRMGLMVLGCAALVLALAATLAGGARWQLHQLQVQADASARAAQQATALRNTLAEANVRIGAAREIAARYPNPHIELARLTALLDDDAYIVHFSQREGLVRVRGQASDAAAVMQRLSAVEAYAEVTAPQAIVRVGNTDREQFYLDLRLRPTGAVAAAAEPGA